MIAYRFTAVIQINAEDREEAERRAEQFVNEVGSGPDAGVWLEDSSPETEDLD